MVVYGPAAHGDLYRDSRDLHVLVVLRDLELATLEPIGEPIRRWLKSGHPMPRLFSPGLIADATDVFPMEFLEIRAHRIVLSGSDPFAELEVTREHLRVQCERELREKLMRVREAYLQAGGKEKLVRQLLADSYVAFAEIFRGCLFLVDEAPPRHNRDVVAAFCRRVEIDPAPFLAVEALLQSRGSAGGIGDLFSQYYGALSAAVHAVDRFVAKETNAS